MLKIKPQSSFLKNPNKQKKKFSSSKRKPFKNSFFQEADDFFPEVMIQERGTTLRCLVWYSAEMQLK